MQVENIMSRNVVTVGLDDTLALVKEIFDHSKFHHLLAMEHGQLLGVVSDRDLFKALSPNLGTSVETYKDTATLNKRVHQIMARKPKFLRQDATVEMAIAMFNEHAISCLPILSHDDRLVGILSWRDILRGLHSRHSGEES